MDAAQRKRLGGFTLGLLLFLVVFPKAGIKVAGIPFTWGLALLAIAAFYCLLRNLAICPPVSLSRITAYIATLAFPCLATIIIATNGFAVLGFVISFYTVFAILPLAMMIIFAADIESLYPESVFAFLDKAMKFLIAFGIVNFLFYALAKRDIAIPLLTTALGDTDVKENLRGPLEKLMSTYNNGNIFGVCMTMLLPLFYDRTSVFWRGMARGAMVLTLSRTAWIGLFLVELYRLTISKKTVLFPIKGVVGVFAAIVLVGIGLAIMGRSFSFLFDPNLGGRIDEIRQLSSIGFWPHVRYSAIAEIVYVSITYQFGIIGLIAFLVAMVIPLAIAARGASSCRWRRDLFFGLAIYLVIAASDGVILFIPTMVFYWAIVSFLLRHGETSNSTNSLRVTESANFAD